MSDQSARAAAGVTGFIATLAALYGAVFVLLAAAVAAQRPDPEVPDGDPCCPYPDTWREVVDWSFAALTVASLDGLLFAGAAACALFARHGHRPSWRRLRLIPLGAVAVTATAMAIALL